MAEIQVYGDAYINVSGHVLEVEHALVPDGHVWFQLRKDRKLSGEEAENRGKSTQVLIDRGYLKKTTYVPVIPSGYLIFEALDDPGAWFSITPEVTETPNELIERPQLNMGNEVWIISLEEYGKVEGINTSTNEYQVRHGQGEDETVDVLPFLDLFLASYFDGETTHQGIHYDSWFGYSYTTERVAVPDPEWVIDYNITVPSGIPIKLEFSDQPPKEILAGSLGGEQETPRFVFRRLPSGGSVPLDTPVAVPISSTFLMMIGSHAFQVGVDLEGRLFFERTQ